MAGGRRKKPAGGSQRALRTILGPLLILCGVALIVLVLVLR